ncbi:MAG TPA: polysaccharide deacetylase family protein [Rugosimonospora sp.]|nr:polysaccharide deacetylase family protein [Rugosimonospora sp.]
MSGRVARATEMSRRALLWAAPGLALGAIAAEGACGPPDAQPHPLPPRSRAPAQAVRHALAPGKAPTRSPLPVQSRPVRTLAQYRSLVPGPAFPAHAVALTIDDGPNPEWTPAILRLLDKYHIPATFFMIGVEARGHAAVARTVAAAGHNIANHTWSHPLSLPKQTPDQMRQQIQRTQDTIHSTTGRVPSLFRSPGGDWSAPLLARTAEAGLVPIDWSDDPRDWSRPGTGQIVSRMLAAKPGQILLCHDGGGDRSQTYQALNTVIPGLLGRGYTFVSL